VVGAQIGAFTHALTHYSQDRRAAAGASSNSPPTEKIARDEPDRCQICLSFGALSHFLAWAPLPVPAPVVPDFVTATVLACAAVAVLPGYRSRAPPPLHV